MDKLGKLGKVGKAVLSVSALGVLVAIASLVVSVLELNAPPEPDKITDPVPSAMIGLMQQQLNVQRAMATAQAAQLLGGAPATAAVDQLVQLRATDQALDLKINGLRSRMGTDTTPSAAVAAQSIPATLVADTAVTVASLTSASTAPARTAIQFSQQVSKDSPFVGAGMIETPKSEDVYSFDAAIGDRIFLDYLEANAQGIGQIIESPSGKKVWSSGGLNDSGELELTETGTHNIVIGNPNSDATGTYRFRLLKVEPPQTFNVKIGDTISTDLPGSGSGRIESPAAEDVYIFDATARDLIFPDFLDNAAPSIGYKIEAPSGSMVKRLGGLVDAGVVELNETGPHKLIVSNKDSDSSGTYRFRLLKVDQPQNFNIKLGDIVSTDAPGGGSGRIESAGSEDTYAFEASSGDVIYPDFLENNAPSIVYRIETPGGRKLVSKGGLVDGGAIPLPETGAYRLIVSNRDSDSSGTYRFRVVKVEPPQTFNLKLGDKVTRDSAGPGSGFIEGPASQDIYVFEGSAGDTLVLDVLSAEAPNLWYYLFDFADKRLKHGGFGGKPELTLPVSGTYRLIISNTEDDTTGSYSFQLLKPA